ncbi:MAG: acyl-phosphate glycerol 3-phosphate acyltransferase [Deltaproteobacteria bacterium GWC2_42_11]|nr:MAG: acyl-phosphate glycerol 3-phosphate acyltransferase [Deltaproteobacteria bacterium GWC2_42_11]HBO85163.1 acyl-phosphate glycerol 3-phosphate acyltransferase [Deltaproteobacteria bacterium]
MHTEGLILIIASYLIGSIPTGIVIARLTGAPDPRTIGSGNIGATNVMRAAGRGAGIITLLIDILKGAVPVILTKYIFSGSVAIISIAGIAAFLGHIFPLFLGFKGGKGVATALGIFLVIAPLHAVAALASFVVITIATRYVSLGSITASFLIVVLFWFFPHTKAYTPLAAAICLLIIIRHTENIKRFLNGTENKIGTLSMIGRE